MIKEKRIILKFGALIIFFTLVITGIYSLQQISEASISQPTIDPKPIPVPISNYSKKLDYQFSIAEKIVGAGIVDLSIYENHIAASAEGKGRAGKYKVGLETILNGSIDNSKGVIRVDMEGSANPPVPGKVRFSGPLIGKFNSKGKLELRGRVNISGYLASYAGFEKSENVLIEISDQTLFALFKQHNNAVALK